MAAAVHPDIARIAALIGTWHGAGAGEYPTIDPFAYDETLTFGHVGKPFLSYQQRTRGPEDGLPMHAETGYWRVPGPGALEMILAQPTGITEVCEGAVSTVGDILRIDVRSTTIGRSASAKDVTITERTFAVDGDVLTYTFRMAAVGQPLQHHLSARLERASDPS